MEKIMQNARNYNYKYINLFIREIKDPRPLGEWSKVEKVLPLLRSNIQAKKILDGERAGLTLVHYLDPNVTKGNKWRKMIATAPVYEINEVAANG
jgi:hypothetical protein